MNDKKFDPQKLQKLNNPKRLEQIPPSYVCEKLNLNDVEVAVDIGAGTGFFSSVFFDQLKPKRLYACDISTTMLEWIKDNVCPSYPDIIPIKNEEKRIPLKSEVADLAFMIALHHELEDPISILKEAKRILKPTGKIFIVDWKRKPMEDGPPLEIRCVPEDVKKQMETVGFKKVAIFSELPKHFLLIGQKE